MLRQSSRMDSIRESVSSGVVVGTTIRARMSSGPVPRIQTHFVPPSSTPASRFVSGVTMRLKEFTRTRVVAACCFKLSPDTYGAHPNVAHDGLSTIKSKGFSYSQERVAAACPDRCPGAGRLPRGSLEIMSKSAVSGASPTRPRALGRNGSRGRPSRQPSGPGVNRLMKIEIIIY